MSTRKVVLVLAITGSLAAPAAFATSGTTLVRGELGYETHPMPSTTTRAEVRQDLERFKRNPVTADGLRFVGGELGWVADTAQPALAPKTRAQVIEELRSFRMSPIAADGWRYVGGEVGWVLDSRPAGAGSRLAGAAK